MTQLLTCMLKTFYKFWKVPKFSKTMHICKLTKKGLFKLENWQIYNFLAKIFAKSCPNFPQNPSFFFSFSVPVSLADVELVVLTVEGRRACPLTLPPPPAWPCPFWSPPPPFIPLGTSDNDAFDDVLELNVLITEAAEDDVDNVPGGMMGIVVATPPAFRPHMRSFLMLLRTE